LRPLSRTWIPLKRQLLQQPLPLPPLRKQSRTPTPRSRLLKLRSMTPMRISLPLKVR
jgi:hypothetical protein